MKLFIKARTRLLHGIAKRFAKAGFKPAEISTQIKAARRRLAARRLLNYLAGIERAGLFSIKFVAQYKRGRRRWQRTVTHPRMAAGDINRVERLLHEAHPKLNRIERRHLARGHRWLFLSQA